MGPPTCQWRGGVGGGAMSEQMSERMKVSWDSVNSGMMCPENDAPTIYGRGLAYVREYVIPSLRTMDPRNEGVDVAALADHCGLSTERVGKLVNRFPRYLQRCKIGNAPSGKSIFTIKLHRDIA